jgi:tetratricopeptide (TPR) repeat protein
MKHLFLLSLLSLVAVVVMAGNPVSAIYIDREYIFNPGTNDLYTGLSGGPSLTDVTNKAASLSNFGKYEEALAKIDEAIKIDPTIGQPYYVKGLILYNMGRFEEALKAYGWAMRMDPDNRNAKYHDLLLKGLTN